MYEAEGDKIFVEEFGKRVLFLTVHATDTGKTMTIEEQASAIADILNEVTI